MRKQVQAAMNLYALGAAVEQGRSRFAHLMALRWLLPIAALTLLAISCGGAEDEVGPLGEVRVGPGDDIQIRTMQSLARVANFGVPNQYGVKLALDDYGPIKGRNVSMGAGLDSLCTGEGGIAAAETIMGDPRVVGVVGPICSVASVQASPLLSEAGLTMISPANTAPSLTSDLRGTAAPDYYPGYFRTASNDLHQSKVVAEFAFNELGLRRTAAIDDGDPYTSGLTSAFSNFFEGLGGTVAVATVGRSDTDMVPVLSQIAAERPDGLFLALFEEAGTAVVQQVGQVPGLEDVTIIGGGALLISEFLVIPESEGMYIAGPDLNLQGNVNEATGVKIEDLEATYEEMFGGPPTSSYMPHAYDATTLLLRAIEEVSVVEGEELVIDRAQLRDALTAVRGFQGFIGVINCDDFGDCGSGAVRISHHADSSVDDPAQLPVVYRNVP